MSNPTNPNSELEAQLTLLFYGAEGLAEYREFGYPPVTVHQAVQLFAEERQRLLDERPQIIKAALEANEKELTRRLKLLQNDFKREPDNNSVVFTYVFDQVRQTTDWKRIEEITALTALREEKL